MPKTVCARPTFGGQFVHTKFYIHVKNTLKTFFNQTAPETIETIGCFSFESFQIFWESKSNSGSDTKQDFHTRKSISIT